MITERLMGVGSWSLDLSPDTPSEVLRAVSLKRFGFGHIVVTPTRVDPLTLGDATLLSLARYVGIYRSQPSEFGMAGVGVNAWLGDEDGKGRSFSALGSGGTGTFSDWRTAILASLQGITAGVTSAIGGTYTKVFGRGVARVAIDDVCKRFGAEWRVTNDFKLDMALASAMFRTTPIAVVVRKDGGRDLNVRGLQGQIDISRDLDDWARRIVFFNTAAGSAAATADGGVATNDTPYRAPDGTYAWIDRIVEDTSAPAATAATVAAAEYALSSSARQEIRMSSEEYDIGGTVRVGDNLWVFDPDRDVINTANPLQYRGTTIFPEVIRCVGQTWPVVNGMGVYFRRYIDNNGATWPVDWVDLTDYVQFENRPMTIEVGAKPRTS